MNPPIVLLSHFYPEIQVKAHHLEAVDEAEDIFVNTFGHEVEVLQSEDDPLLFQVVLTIHNDETPLPRAYDIRLVTVGLFSVDPSCPEERHAGLVNVLAPSMLYGAARDFLYTVTSRTPYPPVYLPTISFIPDACNGDDPPTESAQKNAKPKGRKSKHASS